MLKLKKLYNLFGFNKVLILTFVLLSILYVINPTYADPIANINVSSNQWSGSYSATWDNFREELIEINLDSIISFNIETSDLEIFYYIDKLDSINLEALNPSNINTWNNYIEPIEIKEPGIYVIYVKLEDGDEIVGYRNSDVLVIDGYTKNFNVGRHSGESNYITNKSIITLDFNYSNNIEELLNHTHNLITNILLPINTKITLIDNINEKIYEYKVDTTEDLFGYIDSCASEECRVATYPFTLFKEVGKDTIDNYVESTYYINGFVNESFTIIIDLSNTNIISNYEDVKLYLELRDSINNPVRRTLFSSIKPFNIYNNLNATLFLNTNYNGNPIEYNSASNTSINISSGLNYKYINDYKIIDTIYEDKEIGLSIKLEDSDGNIIDKKYLKNFLFKIGNNIYYPESDNIIRINLNNGINDSNVALTIVTYEINNDLKDGTYYFKISNYVSLDGHYYDTLSNELSIPVNVTNNKPNISHSFDVITNDENRIIKKIDLEHKILFDILYNAELENPNIRVSLYKKEHLNAYDQTYSIVDLSNYVSDALNLATENVYYVTTEPFKYEEPDYLHNSFELNLVVSNFENTGYKYVFELYDGIKKIGTIEKYFIVKEE